MQQPLLDTGYEMRLELGHKFILERDTDVPVMKWTVCVRGPVDASKIDQYVERVGFSLPNADEKGICLCVIELHILRIIIKHKTHTRGMLLCCLVTIDNAFGVLFCACCRISSPNSNSDSDLITLHFLPEALHNN